MHAKSRYVNPFFSLVLLSSSSSPIHDALLNPFFFLAVFPSVVDPYAITKYLFVMFVLQYLMPFGSLIYAVFSKKIMSLSIVVDTTYQLAMEFQISNLYF